MHSVLAEIKLQVDQKTVAKLYNPMVFILKTNEFKSQNDKNFRLKCFKTLTGHSTCQ